MSKTAEEKLAEICEIIDHQHKKNYFNMPSTLEQILNLAKPEKLTNVYAEAQVMSIYSVAGDEVEMAWHEQLGGRQDMFNVRFRGRKHFARLVLHWIKSEFFGSD